nr:hypothetical protein [Tanacetum cinerariifolium]
MPDPRFTKIIINHFISQNKSIFMKNKINLHTARDDILLGTLKYVSKIEERQCGAKEPIKAKKFKNPASPRLKTIPVSSKEPIRKPTTKPKPTKKKAKKHFYISHASGLVDGTNFESGVPDEQQHKISDESDDDNNYDDDDNNGDDSDHERTESDRDKNPNLNQSNKEYEEDVEELLMKKFILLRTMNSLMKKKMNEGPMQSSSVSFDFTDKLLNFKNTSPADNEIASLMDTTICQEEPSGEAIQQAIKSHIAEYREEALADRSEYIDLIDTSVRAIIKEEVKTQLSQILPQASTYEAAVSLSKFELTKILMDKMKEHKSYLRADYKKELYDALYKKPEQPPNPDPDWDKRQHVDFRPPQTWISNIARAKKPPTSFDELMDTPIDLSAFVMNQLNITNLTQELLVVYDKHAYWGTSHWGLNLQRFYGFASNRTSTKDVYSRKRITVVTNLKIMKWYDYGNLDEIEVRREDQELYKFKEGDFPRLRL